jgi:transcriptional regulator with XRE-family HTH domain
MSDRLVLALQAYRERQGVTVAQMARRLELSAAELRKIEASNLMLPWKFMFNVQKKYPDVWRVSEVDPSPEKNPRRSGNMDFGSDEWNEYHNLRHGSRPASDRTKRARSALLKEQQKAQAEERKANQMTAAAYFKILGPTGRTHAIKIISTKKPIDLAAVEGFIETGWKVYAAGTAPGQVGKTLWGYVVNPTEAELERILGPMGKARAVVVALDHAGIDKDTLGEWRGLGFDVAAAPKKMREGIFPVTKNPRPRKTRRKVKRNPEHTDRATEAAISKAKDWFGLDSLLTEPELVAWTPPEAAVLIGRLVAVEYFSDKFDGKGRVYRHDLDRPRDLAISVDGGTLMIFPPLKITKRGIEG